MEANVITFEERSDEIEATFLGPNPEETEVTVEQQELFKKEINVYNMG
jgi:hypothetical protein